MANGELKYVELFVFIDNLVFRSVFYKGASKIPFLFELVLRLYQGIYERIFYPACGSYRENKNY